MKWIILLVFIFLLIIILFMSFSVKLGIHLNVLKNKGFYCLKVGMIKILCGRLQIKDGKLEFENNNDLLFKKSNNEDFINKVFMLILKKINVKTIYVFIEYGNKQNAANTAIVCGIIDSLFCSIFSIIKSKFKNAHQFLDIDANYKKDALETTVSIKISITLIEVLLSIIKAKIMINSEEKNG